MNAVLEHRWPEVAKALAAAPIPPCTVSQTTQRTLVLNGVHLTSGYNRLREAAQQAEMVHAGVPEAWCYGIGLGELPTLLLGRAEKVHVVVMNRGITRVLLEAVGHKWLENPRVAVHLPSELKLVHGPFAVQPIEVRAADVEAYHLRDRLTALLNKPINDELCEKKRQFEKVHEEANAAIIASSPRVTELYGTQQGKSAIVVAGGPSTSQFYGWMRERPDHVLIATSTALRPLMAESIAPHYTCILDSSPQMVAHFDGVVAAGALVYVPHIFPPALSMWTGPRYVARVDNAGGDSDLFPGGSVLFTCVDLAVKMGCTSVYLVGADFCYSDGQSHVAGAACPYDVSQAWRPWTVNGKGERVRTEDALAQYRATLEYYVEQHPTIQFFKLGRRGCPVTGVPWASDD